MSFAIVVLSFGTGAADAFAFQELGGIFTANMTGNLVLIGLEGRPDYLGVLIGASAAIVVFVLMLAAGFALTRVAPGNLVGLRCVMVGVVAAQVCVQALWLGVSGHPTLLTRCLLISASAAAMALQTVVARRLFNALGLTTTFVTGAITALVQDLVEGRASGWALRASSVAALLAGAFAAAGTMAAFPALGPLLPVVAAGVAAPLVLFAGCRAHRADW